MTQNASDVEIANQGFAAFRQDLNDVLEDITTLHSGTAAPTTTYANQWWYETDTDKLYIRNEDNDAWIEILTLDQANDHLASLGASITLDGTGNVSIDGGDFTVDTDTLHVDSTNNRVGIGTSSPDRLLTLQGDNSYMWIKDAGGGNTAFIGSDGTNDGFLRIYDSSHTAKVEIESDGVSYFNGGNVLVGGTSYAGVGLSLANPDNSGVFSIFSGATTGFHMRFGSVTYGTQGSITTSSSATQFNTSSDYRLKENVTGITDGITRVKQLNPSRFNFIADTDATTVDGFLAHEAATVVPEAITGTHNEVETWTQDEIDAGDAPANTSAGDNKLDGDGNTIPVYQGIDQSKLVPLLTAALQEAITKIETLETKVAALESA